MREVIALSVALGLSLVAAYVSWTGEEKVIDDESVMVYAATSSELQRVTWDSEESTVVVSRKSDGKGEYLWIDSTTRKKRLKNPHTKDAASGDREITPEELDEVIRGEDPEEVAEEVDEALDNGEAKPDAEVDDKDLYDVEETSTSFKGSGQADELWDSFAPLQALRELGGAPDADTFGFAEPQGTITVSRKKGDVALVVGGETYGSKDRYVRYGERVFLVDDATLRPLQFAATRLVNRALIPTTAQDTSEIEVTLPSGDRLQYTQRNADDPSAAYWAKKGGDANPDEAAGTWIDKLLRLRLREYTPDRPTAGMAPAFTYTAVGDDGASWSVTLLKGTNDEGGEAWYAQSEHARSVVEVPSSQARNVVDDLDSLTAAAAH